MLYCWNQKRWHWQEENPLKTAARLTTKPQKRRAGRIQKEHTFLRGRESCLSIPRGGSGSERLGLGEGVVIGPGPVAPAGTWPSHGLAFFSGYLKNVF